MHVCEGLESLVFARRYAHTFNAACCQDAEVNCATFTSCKAIEEKKFSDKACTGGSLAPVKPSSAMVVGAPALLLLLPLLLSAITGP